jgi:hypothetical protein
LRALCTIQGSAGFVVMRIIGFITDALTVGTILAHLGEPTTPPRIAEAGSARLEAIVRILIAMRRTPCMWYG